MVAMDFVRAYEPTAAELNRAVADILKERPNAEPAEVRLTLLKQQRSWKVTEKQVAKAAAVDLNNKKTVSAAKSAELTKPDVKIVRVYEPTVDELDRAIKNILKVNPSADVGQLKTTMMKQHRTWKLTDKKIEKVLKLQAEKKANPPLSKKESVSNIMVRTYKPRTAEALREIESILEENPNATEAQLRAGVMKRNRSWYVTEKKIAKALRLKKYPSARRASLRAHFSSQEVILGKNNDDASASSRSTLRSVLSRSSHAVSSSNVTTDSSKAVEKTAQPELQRLDSNVTLGKSDNDASLKSDEDTAEVSLVAEEAQIVESKDIVVDEAVAEESPSASFVMEDESNEVLNHSLAYLSYGAGMAVTAGLLLVAMRAAKR